MELLINPNKPTQYLIVDSKVAKWVELGLVIMGLIFIGGTCFTAFLLF